MNENTNKYQKIKEISFDEINTDLQKSKFIEEYSKLSFNDGFLFKTIEAKEKEIFKELSNQILKLNENFDVNIKFQKASKDVNDFLYYIITNESLIAKKWGIHEDDEDFLEIVDEFKSLENFKNLTICELNTMKLQRRLYEIAKSGSIYDDWTLSDRLTEKIISDFVNSIFQKNEEYRIFEFENWGDYIMGFFDGFIFINISKSQISFFVKDDYD
jgi:hypothetical protein